MNRFDLEMLLEQKAFEITPSNDLQSEGPLNLIMLDHPYFITTEKVNREFCQQHSDYARQEPLVSMEAHRSHESSSHRKKTGTKHPKAKKKQRWQQQTETGSSHDFLYDLYVPRRTRRQRDIYEQLFEEPVNIKQQCLGPGCVYAARQGSKYCSDECGIKLAKLRLQTFLPERVKEWNATPCTATQLDEQKLKQLAIKQEKLHGELRLLDEQKNRLEETIKRAKRVPIIDEPEVSYWRFSIHLLVMLTVYVSVHCLYLPKYLSFGRPLMLRQKETLISKCIVLHVAMLLASRKPSFTWNDVMPRWKA
jgi:hypothetical protein